MRRLLTLALTVLALTGCRDILAPEEVVGTSWTLVSIMGEGLPYQEAGTLYLILEGWLRFYRNSTYTLAYHRQLTRVKSAEVRIEVEGIYFISGSYAHLHARTGGYSPEAWARASVEGDTLWLEGMANEQPTGSTSVYQRLYEFP